MKKLLLLFLFALLATAACTHQENTQQAFPAIEFRISFPGATTHQVHVEMIIPEPGADTLVLKMPVWMPGYYQVMDYAADVRNLSMKGKQGTDVSYDQVGDNCWIIQHEKEWPVTVSYDIQTSMQFVARNYVDSAHAYILPCNTYLYPEGMLHEEVVVSVEAPPGWTDIATGLKPVSGNNKVFTAPDYDILYDCPILLGDLEVLPEFDVGGVPHRFMAYQPGDFDRDDLMAKLQKIVQTATGIIGEIPYDQYTFIGIGPGRGGIEHLNNTTISFSSETLNSERNMKGTLAFIAHEYFHNYNVKRIRPFELGPFDYDRENRTNLLWVSEGFTVYYEYILLRRSGLIGEQDFLDFLGNDLNAIENDEGRHYESLQQASYYTWEEGPFGSKGSGEDRSISYYEKGAVAGLLLDLSIRHATGNEKSLDDVMRVLYYKYYRELGRGFTDAEFQQECENIAGVSLKEVFEYVYTTKEIDYTKFLSFAGLTLEKEPGAISRGHGAIRYRRLVRMEDPSGEQLSLFNDWSRKTVTVE